MLLFLLLLLLMTLLYYTNGSTIGGEFHIRMIPINYIGIIYGR